MLSGYKVLDLTNVLAGPYCAYQLALLGAEVIKVEAPGTGDLARQLGADPELSASLMGASFLAQNSNKKSVVINLKKEAGKDLFRRLVANADVVIENFRPGVMERLGLAYDDLKGLNDGLVYCAISGFGQDGPMRGAPAYDQIVQGLSGIMSITGDQTSAPLRVGYPVCDSIGGITAAFAIVSALLGRSRSGRGNFIDVSMLDSSIATMGWVVSNYLIAGKEPEPMGNDNFTAAPSGAFQTKQGLLNIAANKQEQFVALAGLLGREDLVSDPRFANREARKQNRGSLSIEIAEALQGHSAEEWEVLLNQAGVPAGRVLTVPEALALQQVRERGLVHSFSAVEDIERPISVTLAGYKMREDGPSLQHPPSSLGAHTEEVLSSLGLSAREILALREEGVL